MFFNLLQGLMTLSFIFGTWALARGAGVPARARMAANCMAAMAFTQVAARFSVVQKFGQKCHNPL